MVYIPRKRLDSVEEGIKAWKDFNQTGKELAIINLKALLGDKGK